MKVVSQEQLHFVPYRMVDFVNYLNRILKLDPEAISKVLDVEEKCSDLCEKDDKLIVRSFKDDPTYCAITPMGIMFSYFNTDVYRIAAQWDGDDTTKPIDRFVILEL